jgi:hypothetical protein
MRCGICGGNLIGQTDKFKRADGSIRLRKRYVCGIHHKGQVDQCPERYYVPIEAVEGKVWEYLKEDFQQLQGDQKMHGYIQTQLTKASGSQQTTKKALQARLSDVDGQIAKLTTHLAVLDVQTATTLGLYAKAKALADERQQVQTQLAGLAKEAPDMPSAEEIARRADAELANLDTLLESGSLEQKRELVRTYVKGMKVDPKAQEIELSIMPPLFSWIGTGGRGRGRRRRGHFAPAPREPAPPTPRRRPIRTETR